MNRRNFLGAVGTGAVVMRQGVGREFPDSSAKRLRIDLNGPWRKSVANVFVRTIDVPSSQRPSGSYELSREIILPRLAKGEHAILHFEGITYFARAFSNGTELGGMDPYVPYEFDITRSVRERSNVISLQMADLGSQSDHNGTSQIELGVNPGWEGYGGIIRNVWIEIRPPTFINTAQFRYELTADFSSAECRLRAELVSASPVSGRIQVSLRHLGQIVVSGAQAFSAQAGTSEAEVPLKVADPALWSTESPDLYDVLVSLQTSGVVDELSFRTGFRQFRVAGSSFQLNGREILLNGVCRHDMWKEQGFTLTGNQMKHDMRAIKAMGFNFVRLVHYPHDRYVVELADELGLLVSEEPGYWNVDFHIMRTPVKDLGL
jgi:beta-galactosidase